MQVLCRIFYEFLHFGKWQVVSSVYFAVESIQVELIQFFHNSRLINEKNKKKLPKELLET